MDIADVWIAEAHTWETAHEYITEEEGRAWYHLEEVERPRKMKRRRRRR